MSEADARSGRVVLISHLAAPDGVTGAERSLLNLGVEFRARGRDVEFVSPQEGMIVEEARTLDLPVEVRAWPRLFTASYTASAPMTLLRGARFAVGSPRLLLLSRQLRRHRPGVAVVNTLVNVGAAWAARRAGLGVVWRVADIPGAGGRASFFRRAANRYADRVIAVSEAVSEALGAEETTVVPSGVVVPSEEEILEARIDLRDRLNLATDAVVIGHVGQIRPHKGQREFVEALLQPAVEWSGETYVVAGSTGDDPRYVAELKELAAPLGRRIAFPGFLPGATAAVDVLVFTSLAPDPFPLVVLEAMAAGIPVVAFSGGGVPEVVVHGRTGLLVETGDVRTLAHAIHMLGSRQDRRDKLGAASRRRIIAGFTRDRAAAGYDDIIEEVMEIARQRA